MKELKCGSLGVNRKLESGWSGVTLENIECIEHVIEALNHVLVRYGRGFYKNAHSPFAILVSGEAA